MVILGISSSPILNGNTDRIVQALLTASNKATAFINLTQLSYGGCMACVHRCANDNMCKIDDDLKPLYPKIMDAEALVLGTPSYFNNLNSYMATFLERLWSFRHQQFPLQDKPFVAIGVGGIRHPSVAVDSIIKRMTAYRAVCIGSVSYTTKIYPCYKCGYGHLCRVGSFYRVHGEAGLQTWKITDQLFRRWEENVNTVTQVEALGQILARE